MRIRNKISLIITFILLLATFVSALITVISIKEKAKTDIETYRTEEIKTVKKNLKNLVNLAYETIDANYRFSQNKKYVEKFYGKRLKDIIDVTESILNEKLQMVKSGKLSLQEAQKQAAQVIKDIRYNNSGYIWINDLGLPYPKMIMHPMIPSLDNTILDNPKFNCALGKKQNLFQAAVEACKRNGEGFIDYRWPKPNKDGTSIPDVQKLSYVRLFKPWNWVLGVGVYIDDAVHDAKEMSKEDIKKMRYNNGIGYFWINTTDLPYPKMVMHSISPSLDGKVLNAPKYNCAMGRKENLFAAMVKVCEKDGQGYVDYLWPKPTKDGAALRDVPKLSYVKIFKPWNWIIGTGVYIDNIDQRIAREEAAITAHVNILISKILICSIAILIVAIVLSFIFADTIASPIRKLVKTMKIVDLDNISTSKVKLKGSREIKELGGIFNEMLVSINNAVIQLEKTTAEKEKIEGELNIAREIQMSIIPKLFPAFPERPEFDVFATIDTAKAVGGDLYDFFFLDDDHLCFAVGDVSGKGIPASLFMAVTQTILRAKTTIDMNAGEVVTSMNKVLCADNEMSMFVTFFMCILNIRTGEIEYCNAGHNPPYIIKDQKTVEPLSKLHGIPLGIMGDHQYSSDKITLKPNDTICLYTDGVTEAMNIKNELFDENRLEKTLVDCKKLSPKETTELIHQRVKEFAGEAEQADDITILVLHFTGG